MCVSAVYIYIYIYCWNMNNNVDDSQLQAIATAVGDWYFDRATVKAIDCPYPCDKTCSYPVIKQ